MMRAIGGFVVALPLLIICVVIVAAFGWEGVLLLGATAALVGFTIGCVHVGCTLMERS